MNAIEPGAGPIRYIYWEEDGTWLGYVEEFPDYWTQGASQEDLQEHLKNLYKDLTSGEVPNIRRVAHSKATTRPGLAPVCVRLAMERGGARPPA